MKLPKIAICKPVIHSCKWVFDVKHIIHFLTFGILLIDHIEPDGKSSFEHHKNLILW